VNACLLYNEEGKKMQISEFRENIITSLTQKRGEQEEEDAFQETRHMLIETDERTRETERNEDAALLATPQLQQM